MSCSEIEDNFVMVIYSNTNHFTQYNIKTSEGKTEALAASAQGLLRVKILTNDTVMVR